MNGSRPDMEHNMVYAVHTKYLVHITHAILCSVSRLARRAVRAVTIILMHHSSFAQHCVLGFACFIYICYEISGRPFKCCTFRRSQQLLFSVADVDYTALASLFPLGVVLSTVVVPYSPASITIYYTDLILSGNALRSACDVEIVWSATTGAPLCALHASGDTAGVF